MKTSFSKCPLTALRGRVKICTIGYKSFIVLISKLTHYDEKDNKYLLFHGQRIKGSVSKWKICKVFSYIFQIHLTFKWLVNQGSTTSPLACKASDCSKTTIFIPKIFVTHICFCSYYKWAIYFLFRKLHTFYLNDFI